MPLTRNQSALSQDKSNAGALPNAAASAESREPSEEGASGDTSHRDSPENCSICLGPFNNKSFTSSCAHSFCFVCLKQWSKVKAECPLCKQPFTSIFHNIRSNQSYDIFELPPPRNAQRVEYTYLSNLVGGGPTMFTAPPLAHHHYLSLPHPSLDADLTLSNFSRFRFGRRHPQQAHHPLHNEHQYSYTGLPINTNEYRNGESWPRGPEEFRRTVYRCRLGPPVVVLGMEGNPYRLTPAMVAASAHRMQRIMPWLLRELKVLLSSRGEHSINLAVSVIQPLLTQVSIDSEEFLRHVTPLFGRRAPQFIEQFVAFANSALPMQAYDRKAYFRSGVLQTSSGSSSSDDDIEITSVSPASNSNNNSNNGNNNERPGPSAGLRSSSGIAAAVPNTSNNSGSLSRHGWDSPIPGPSWEMLNVDDDDDDDDVQIQEEPVCVSSESDDPVFRPDARQSDSDVSKTGSDLVFLKYDKPWNDRSPIKLSSDSDAEGSSKKKKKSKHKKKSKDNESKKPIRIKIRRKHRSHRSKDNNDDDYEVGSDSSDDENIRRSQSAGSGERSSNKKHKKSKDRNKKSSRRNSDRDLVDRLFAEAIAQPDLTSAIFEDEIGGSSPQTEAGENQQSGKSREKRKKRKRGSSSPSSLSRSYKKHHSGHKKSSDQNRSSNMPSSMGGFAQVGGTSSSSQSNPSEGNNSLGLSGLSIPQMAGGRSGFQPPFIPMPDTVQHIPLNLWVSTTWPALSVSAHPYGSAATQQAAASSTLPPPPPLPQLLNMPLPRAGERVGMASHTISSSSSDDEADDLYHNDHASRRKSSRGNKSSGSHSSNHKRTNRWVQSVNYLANQTDKEHTAPSSSASASSTLAKPDKQQPQKVSSYSADFLAGSDRSAPSATVEAQAQTGSTLKETIDLACSSDEVLVCSSEQDSGSDSDSSEANSVVRKILEPPVKEMSQSIEGSAQEASKNADNIVTQLTESSQTTPWLPPYDKHFQSELQPPSLPCNRGKNMDATKPHEKTFMDLLFDSNSGIFSNNPALDIPPLNIPAEADQTCSKIKTVTSPTTIASLAATDTNFLSATKAGSVLSTVTPVSTTSLCLFPNSIPVTTNSSITSTLSPQGGFLSFPALPPATISFPPLPPQPGQISLEGASTLQDAFRMQPIFPMVSSTPSLFDDQNLRVTPVYPSVTLEPQDKDIQGSHATLSDSNLLQAADVDSSSLSAVIQSSNLTNCDPPVDVETSKGSLFAAEQEGESCADVASSCTKQAYDNESISLPSAVTCMNNLVSDSMEQISQDLAVNDRKDQTSSQISEDMGISTSSSNDPPSELASLSESVCDTSIITQLPQSYNNICEEIQNNPETCNEKVEVEKMIAGNASAKDNDVESQDETDSAQSSSSGVSSISN